jgi:septal ring factor EnvC (AmiA/AmiB activator)
MNPKVLSLVFTASHVFSFNDFILLTLFCITSLFSSPLTKALARVTYLEAKLKTTSKALKDANTAKASVERATKAVETKAKKAEKALAEVA